MNIEDLKSRVYERIDECETLAKKGLAWSGRAKGKLEAYREVMKWIDEE
jgi:hypothetical protein